MANSEVPTRSPSQPDAASAAATTSGLIARLLQLSWNYRWHCVRVLALQLVILALALSGLGFVGLGIDFIREQLQPGTALVRWPLGLHPPGGWSPMMVLELIAGAALGFAIVRGFLQFLYTVSITNLVQGQIVVDLRAQIYDKLQRLSFRFFDANASSSIINRVTGDVQAVRSFIDEVVMQSVIMLLSLAIYLVYMFHIHVTLTLACLATTPLLWVLSAMFSRVVHPAYVRTRLLFDDLILVLSESIQGIPVLRAFAVEEGAINRFRAANARLRDQQEGIFWQVSIFNPAIGLLSQLNLVVLLGFGGYLVIHNQLPLGTGMVVFAGMLQQFSGQVANIANVANSMQQSLAASRRVFEILDAPIEIQSPPHPAPMPAGRGRIRFEDVTFAYSGAAEPALRELTFDVEPGECIALVGRTGAGKSSLLGLLPRFYDPTAGRVLLGGTDLRDLDLDSLRRNIGIVFQESFIFSASVAANIAFGHPSATDAQIERAARIACAHDFITRLPNGYNTILQEGGSNLSGGQRQRIAIARALLLEPQILILDDPTAAVDPGTEDEILTAMDQAMRGRTTFVVAHRLSTLRRAHRIFVIEAGRLVQTGTHAELLQAGGHYRETAALQMADKESRRILEEEFPA